nr:MAG TPA: hypothetical protein [Bacteriophage sp.]
MIDYTSLYHLGYLGHKKDRRYYSAVIVLVVCLL